MDKNVLKKFAIESRQELMEKVANKINRYFVDEEFNVNQNGEVYVLVNDKHTLRLTKSEYENRQLLVKRIKEITLEQVIEEAAYTWFNRIIAIRYMEIHDYLPLTKDNQSLGVRVLSSKDNTPDPEIMKISNLINPDLDIEFNKEYYGTIQDNNKKFEYILLLICKKLGKVIPQVFDGITDYIDILVPNNLLNESGYVAKLLKDVSVDNFEQVEIIGWLYQFYISEKKDDVFKKLKKNIKISKDNVPAATQLFTPNWIVKYMVENTICKYIVDNNILKEEVVVNKFKYYIKNEKSEDKLGNKKIEDLKFLDPCCGSGHILVYAFQVLFEIYSMLGYKKDDIPCIIINKNLYGLDIDERAKQLSILSLILIANKYDSDLLNKKININIYNIIESNNIDTSYLKSLCNENEQEQIDKIENEFKNAREYGSLINLDIQNIDTIIEKINDEPSIFGLTMRKELLPLFCSARILGSKFDICVTNPPYMGQKGMTSKLLTYVKKYYNDSKVDTFSCFIERVANFTNERGYYAMITQPSILFLSSFDKLRKKIVENKTILSVLHMGRGIFGVDFGSVAFVIKNVKTKNNIGAYYKLHKRTFQYIDVNDIETLFLNAKDNINYKYDFSKYVNNTETDDDFSDNTEEIESEMSQIKFLTNQDNFLKIKGTPFAYWTNENVIELFSEKESLGDVSEPRAGLQTSDNNRFLRLWQEINFLKIGFNCLSRDEAKESKKKWFPYNKGGEFRKWYGNNYYLVNYENDGYEIKEFVKEKYKDTDYAKDFTKERWDKLIEVWVVKNQQFYFRKSITWSFVSSTNFGVRLSNPGYIFDVGGSSIFPDDNDYYYVAGLLNSKLSVMFLRLLNPTMNFQVGDIKKIPFINIKEKNNINELIKKCVEISKNDWDSFETSWEFNKHPLLEYNEDGTIENAYRKWKCITEDNFEQLKENEEMLNKYYIDIYNLQDNLSAEVKDSDVTIRKADKEREIKSLISYAVGCMFGRYSLDENGLIYAGGDFNKNRYKLFEVDTDNVIPLTEGNYFGDDIVTRFKKFIEVSYGSKTLYDNLEFIAETLGKKNGENNEETIRRYFINDFYNDHVKMYQKRPIYWLFDSGKKNGFKCLIYMHRYNEGLVSKIRLDYLHRIQNTYEKELKEITNKLNNDVDLVSKRELSKKQADISAKLQETNEYDEKIAHIADQKIKIDLDDGVIVNYAKFSVKNPKTGKDESILAKIK